MRIQYFEIHGFRSLSDVKINGLGPVNIFYGENNAGKSNILAAFEIAFRVERVEELESPVAGFLRSEFSDFVDNFTINPDGTRATKIDIKVRIGLSDEDLEVVPTFSKLIKDTGIYEGGHLQRIQLETETIPTSQYTATRLLTKASVNNKSIYDLSQPEVSRFFPSLRMATSDRQSSAEELFRYLMNCYEVIYAQRFLKEEELLGSRVGEMSVIYFKNWLLSLSESRAPGYTIFRDILKWFNQEPFNFGDIRPIVENGKVNLMVRTNRGTEFTIDRLGTGVQQILLLLSSVLANPTKLIAIEEMELNLSPSLQNNTLLMLKDIVANNVQPKDQVFLSSHSMHLGRRFDTILYAVKLNSSGLTEVSRGRSAIASLRSHFDFGLFRIPRSKMWRS